MLRSDLLMPLPLDLFVGYDDAAGVDCDQAAADVGVFHVPFKCQVVRAQAVVTETCAGGTTTPIVKFDKRPTAGSDTGRGDGDIANLVLGTTAQGKVLYDEAAPGDPAGTRRRGGGGTGATGRRHRRGRAFPSAAAGGGAAGNQGQHDRSGRNGVTAVHGLRLPVDGWNCRQPVTGNRQPILTRSLS